MKQITEITADPSQEFIITTEAGDTFTLLLEFSDLQESWFCNITFGDTILNGRKIVTHANLLRSFKNTLPFGIAITTNDGGEPIFIDDFTSGRAGLFVLEQSEVDFVESEFFSQ